MSTSSDRSDSGHVGYFDLKATTGSSKSPPYVAPQPKQVCIVKKSPCHRPSAASFIYWWATRPRFDRSRMSGRDSLIQTATHFDVSLTDMFSHLRHRMQLAHRTSMLFVDRDSIAANGGRRERVPKMVAVLAMEELCMDNDFFNKALRFELHMGIVRPDINNRHIVFNVLPTNAHNFSLNIVFYDHPAVEETSYGPPPANNKYHTTNSQTFSGEIQLVTYASSGTTLYFCRACDCFKSDESRCASFSDKRSVTKRIAPWRPDPKWDPKRVDELSWESLKSRAVETSDFFSRGHTVLAKFTIEITREKNRFFPMLKELLD